jgi:hypothetical protein
MDTPIPEPTPKEEAPTIEIENVFQGRISKQISGHNIQFNNGIAGSVTAQNDLAISNSLVFVTRGESDLNVQDSGGVAMVAGGNLQLTNGGAQVIVAGGGMELTNGGAQIMVVGGEMNAHKSFVGVAIANQLNLSEDSKVLLDKTQALIFGVALGAVFAVISWLLKRKA